MRQLLTLFFKNQPVMEGCQDGRWYLSAFALSRCSASLTQISPPCANCGVLHDYHSL